ncbi:MAG: hypothetical protein WBZ40_02705, partial [Acidimicrobiia bacterium]
LSMNLVTKAAIFNREKRPRDAIEILKDVVASSKEIGFRRMTQMGLRQLGDAYFAIDEMEAAEAADLESLAMSEEMGMVMEMAGMVATIASIRTRMGKLEEAVELLASVLTDEWSQRALIYSEIYSDDSIEQMARGFLTELSDQLDEPTFEAARARGAARSLEVTVKELLNGTV